MIHQVVRVVFPLLYIAAFYLFYVELTQPAETNQHEGTESMFISLIFLLSPTLWIRIFIIFSGLLAAIIFQFESEEHTRTRRILKFTKWTGVLYLFSYVFPWIIESLVLR